MQKQRKWAPFVASGLLAIVVALMGVMVLPQATLAAPATSPVAGRGVVGMAPWGNDAFLADALGITTEKLTEARQAAYQAGVQEALDKGLITQAQADMLKKNTRGFGRGFGPFVGGDQIDEEKLLANALNITVEQLQAAEKKAEEARIAQAVTDGKITQEQADNMKARSALQTWIQEQGWFKKILDEAVKAGIITQAQADTFLNQANNRGGGMLPFGGKGGRGDFGGRGGLRGWITPGAAPSATGTTL